MKICIVYNRNSKNVINLFGVPNREKYGLKAIKRISDSLRDGGHQVLALEGDKDLIDRIEIVDNGDGTETVRVITTLQTLLITKKFARLQVEL